MKKMFVAVGLLGGAIAGIILLFSKRSAVRTGKTTKETLETVNTGSQKNIVPAQYAMG